MRVRRSWWRASPLPRSSERDTRKRAAMKTNLAASVAVIAAIAATSPAAAQDTVADFYRDRSVTVVIGTSAGGGVDTYGRLVARHIGKYIPGSPRVVAANMPGAGTLVATVHMY